MLLLSDLTSLDDFEGVCEDWDDDELGGYYDEDEEGFEEESMFIAGLDGDGQEEQVEAEEDEEEAEDCEPPHAEEGTRGTEVGL